MLVFVISAIPVVATVLVISSTTEPNLSGLTPIVRQAGGYRMLSWPELSLDEGYTVESGVTAVQILGYMMDGDQGIPEGQWVRDFILLPEPGTLLHPAHRLRDQMISVHLAERDSVRFQSRRMVWVCGTLRASPGDPSAATPLYTIESARIRPAAKKEIARYYHY